MNSPSRTNNVMVTLIFLLFIVVLVLSAVILLDIIETNSFSAESNINENNEINNLEDDNFEHRHGQAEEPSLHSEHPENNTIIRGEGNFGENNENGSKVLVKEEDGKRIYSTDGGQTWSEEMPEGIMEGRNAGGAMRY